MNGIGYNQKNYNGSIVSDLFNAYTEMNYRPLSFIEKVIFNGPATIVFWKDGEKTVVMCNKDDVFDKEKGLAMAIVKRMYQVSNRRFWFGDGYSYYRDMQRIINNAVDYNEPDCEATNLLEAVEDLLNFDKVAKKIKEVDDSDKSSDEKPNENKLTVEFEIYGKDVALQDYRRFQNPLFYQNYFIERKDINCSAINLKDLEDIIIYTYPYSDGISYTLSCGGCDNKYLWNKYTVYKHIEIIKYAGNNDKISIIFKV